MSQSDSPVWVQTGTTQILPRDLDAFKAPSHLVPQNKTFDTTTSSFNVCVQQSLHILLHLL